MLLKYNQIDIKAFYIQYLAYPRSIGSSRFLDISFEDFLNKFKFILLPVVILTYFKLKKKNTNFSSEEFIKWLVFLSFTIIMIFHQIMTKNQIYIYFLIPILFGFLENELSYIKIKKGEFISIFLICLMSFITIKYHYRFNDNRKFHELNKSQLKNSIQAYKIDKNLKNLKWLNPSFSSNPSLEASILKKGIVNLDSNFGSKIMLITHYLFLDSVTKNNLNYPSKTFTFDGTSMPLKGNKFYTEYKLYLLNKIEKKNIQKILFFKHENLSHSIITDYIKEDCYEKMNDEIFYIFKLNC